MSRQHIDIGLIALLGFNLTLRAFDESDAPEVMDAHQMLDSFPHSTGTVGQDLHYVRQRQSDPHQRQGRETSTEPLQRLEVDAVSHRPADDQAVKSLGPYQLENKILFPAHFSANHTDQVDVQDLGDSGHLQHELVLVTGANPRRQQPDGGAFL